MITVLVVLSRSDFFMILVSCCFCSPFQSINRVLFISSSYKNLVVLSITSITLYN